MVDDTGPERLELGVYPVTADTAASGAENTVMVRARVLAAREAAAERWGALGFHTNAEVSPDPEI